MAAMAASLPGGGPGTVNWADLLPPTWERIVDAYLADDTPSFDVGGFVVGSEEDEAWLLGKSAGVLAGVPFFDCVFRKLGCTVEWLAPEGETISPVAHVATVRGPRRMLLLGERTALNILTRASGIATEAAKAAAIKASSGWAGEVAGTRKLTPGFRLVEKYALLVGGCGTHRMDLSQMTMIKDNHVWAAGSIPKAVAKARSACGFSSKIEVEARTLEEAKEAASAGADVVMLDNFEPDALEAAAAAFKAAFPHVLVEASGGIRLDTLGSYMRPGVDVLSMGSLTQGYPCLDFSLKLRKGITSGEANHAAEVAGAKA
ncbi:hypothetical protein FNF29_00463 [Cafeteria roenbergensis]|uniref:Nicotinate-nucleotide pyrophosphorylase [carboxylating] n=1 Tax=Cafeteria roenbergensis TaxID=33653 RepID=A0A5A8CZ98_CAFRO|nr:hypothetical protein FNF29_00463 [Cafeteria roenbergensis]|eukprot:KAA0157111.1 hypothetical protein FNF29_00463 [Cafeteria roenbergensis]